VITKLIASLEKIVYPLNKVGQRIAMFILFFMMVITFIDVAGRSLGSPLPGTFELTGFSLALLIFFSLGYTQIQKGHITISFIVDMWPKTAQAIANTITNIIFLLLSSLLTWQLWEHAMRLYAGNEQTVDLGLPVYIFVIMAFIGTLFFALAILLDLLKSINEVVSKDEL